VKSTKTSDSVSADLVGTMKIAISEILRATEVTAASLEFGTLPPRAVLSALIAENWLHHHGNPRGKEANRIKADMRQAFYTETDEWKAAVWEQGRQVILQAAEGLMR
jgi:hypothetical protein